MISTPRVSVLLPARNAAATLGACLASLARQTLTDWECLVVDDGSTDGTEAAAREAAARDPRVRIVPLPHVGLVAALNEGLRRCRAPLIARMDADDVMHRERLAVQVQHLDNDSRLSGVGCHVRLFPRGPLSARRIEYETWLNGLTSAEDIARDAFVECPVAHPSLMMTRRLAALGYRDEGWPEDYDLVLRSLAAGLRIGVVARRLLLWRDGPARLSRTAAVYDIERFTACKAFHLATGFLSGGSTYVLWGYGDTGRRLRQALLAHNKVPTHIVEVKATRIGQRIHGAEVVAPEGLAELRGRPLLVSVARAGPRGEIRAALSGMRFVEGRDYLCCA